ncbi:MAG: hypothetical protein R8K20_04145 [Gallionellaceae bacterium]
MNTIYETNNAEDRCIIANAGDVRADCDLILASDTFLKAPRMCRLLSFLVEKAISGEIHDTTEHAVGVAVFDKSPTAYNTNDDPIVRIQIGRLRKKLKDYYATVGGVAVFEITIPVGCYMPIIRPMNASYRTLKYPPVVAIQPFKCVSHHENGAFFTQGLYDELAYQLFKALGKIVVGYSSPRSTDGKNERRTKNRVSRAGVNHRLEGCVQIDAEFVKATIRLVDASTGYIAWSEQFNRNLSLAITLQDELATSICVSLKHYFSLE